MMLKIYRMTIGLVTAISLFCMLSVTAHAETAATANTLKVAENVYRFDGKNGYFSMFVVTDEGVVVIESINPDHSKGLLAAIKSITDKPVRYLLHSHNHVPRQHHVDQIA